MTGDFEAYFDKVTAACMAYYRAEGPMDLAALATALMDMEGFPIHAPVHHYLVPAMLLTACRRAQGHTPEVLERDLALAQERGHNVPGGYCGFYGACGACVGVGIFWSIITDTTPLSSESWAYGNRATGTALLDIAQVGGPRCCKRCTYLSLHSALEQIRTVLGLEIAMSTPACHFHGRNKECIEGKCPYFPAPETDILVPTFVYPKKDPEHPCPCQERPVELSHKTGVLYWLKTPGERVELDEPVAEVEVEKKNLTIPSPAAGILSACHAQEGDTVGCGALLGTVRGV